GAYHAFQVCHTLTPLNRDREYAGFNALNENLKIESKTLITYDTNDNVGDIRIVPFWDFFGI
ncbi:MAG: ATP-binding protein, partial [Dysgonamonadaceae bacterium]|nr:ATP-binding protein [Dysgonamonadaceae bacterium]